MAPRLRPLALYPRIAWTYVRWARVLLPLALVVFVPLGLIHAITLAMDPAAFESGFAIAGVVAAGLVLTATGLLGEVFYAGVVTVALTHPHDGRPPSLREIAGMLNYGSLIVIDLLYGAAVAVGLLAFVVPGIVVFVYLGLAAPVIEIERHGVRAAISRSFQLVRGRFWSVLAILLPLELLGDGLTDLATALAHGLLGKSLLTDWLVDTLLNVLVTPFYAVAAALLAVELIAEKDGRRPGLHSASAPP
ncbi:MAG: hypothetical protein WBM00_01285 [Solirubrobacterales bacterium]